MFFQERHKSRKSYNRRGYKRYAVITLTAKDPYTSMKIRKSTRARIVGTRGRLEHKNGKRRSMEDVINELIDFFEKHNGENEE